MRQEYEQNEEQGKLEFTHNMKGYDNEPEKYYKDICKYCIKKVLKFMRIK
jgi:hypothetical protein